jgi:hypothetical protein
VEAESVEVMSTTEAEKLARIAACARAFLRAYDEFGDDYPPAVGEWLDPLVEAVDGLGDDEAAVLARLWIQGPRDDAPVLVGEFPEHEAVMWKDRLRQARPYCRVWVEGCQQ